MRAVATASDGQENRYTVITITTSSAPVTGIMGVTGEGGIETIITDDGTLQWWYAFIRRDASTKASWSGQG